MASDDECYYDDDGEEEGMEVDEDEDDFGLLDESSPLLERRADYWVSNLRREQTGASRP